MRLFVNDSILNEKLNSTFILNLVLLSSSISFIILVPSIRSRKEVLMCKSIPVTQKHMTMDQRIIPSPKKLKNTALFRNIALSMNQKTNVLY